MQYFVADSAVEEQEVGHTGFLFLASRSAIKLTDGHRAS